LKSFHYPLSKIRKALWKKKNVEPMKDGEFLIGGNALTLITKGGNVGVRQTRDPKKREEMENKKSL
jgi:hypothetical protein